MEDEMAECWRCGGTGRVRARDAPAWGGRVVTRHDGELGYPVGCAGVLGMREFYARLLDGLRRNRRGEMPPRPVEDMAVLAAYLVASREASRRRVHVPFAMFVHHRTGINEQLDRLHAWALAESMLERVGGSLRLAAVEHLDDGWAETYDEAARAFEDAVALREARASE